jgi:hypothetical protein
VGGRRRRGARWRRLNLRISDFGSGEGQGNGRLTETVAYDRHGVGIVLGQSRLHAREHARRGARLRVHEAGMGEDRGREPREERRVQRRGDEVGVDQDRDAVYRAVRQR